MPKIAAATDHTLLTGKKAVRTRFVEANWITQVYVANFHYNKLRRTVTHVFVRGTTGIAQTTNSYNQQELARGHTFLWLWP